MNLRSRNFLVVVSLVLLLCVGGVGMAVASPDGDDDSGYNANASDGTFGTQFSVLGPDASDGERFGAQPPRDSHPVTTQDTSSGGNGSSVTAMLLNVGDSSRFIQLQRYDGNGKPVAGFGNQETEDGVAVNVLPLEFDGFATEILDVRVLSSGDIRVLLRANDSKTGESPAPGDRLWILDYDSEGEPRNGDRSFVSPDDDDCQEQLEARGDGLPIFETNYNATLNAARVGSDGEVSALWTCTSTETFLGNDSSARPRGLLDSNSVYVSLYADDAEDETDHDAVDTASSDGYGEDLELGPGGDPYVLTGAPDDSGIGLRGGPPSEYSQVFHFSVDDGVVAQDPQEGSEPSLLPALPVDLAVDSQGRPIVWTEADDGENDWIVSRLTASLELDGSWGTGGTSTITNDDLQPAASAKNNSSTGASPFGREPYLFSLTVRPGDRVLVTGQGPRQMIPLSQAADTRGGTTTQTTPDPTPIQSSAAIIAGLTNTGATDTTFGTNGFRVIDFTLPGVIGDDVDVQGAELVAVGEPKVQADGKVLIPHATIVGSFPIGGTQDRITPPPADGSGYRFYVGVSRLAIPAPEVTPSTPAAGAPRPSAARPVRPSSVPAQCGRRVISLVRADVRGSKIRLTGLVGSRLYGKKVTIETNPTAVKASAYSRTTTVTASKRTGAFSATVAAPKRSQFKTVRYRAKSGGATSPVLKLPQSLTSRSVKSAKGTITVKGQVKRSVLGKRNNVKIRRLVCGRYRTVAVVRPDAKGRYTATFKASRIRGVSFYRAEIVVQVKPGSKKYAIQYARAIAIRTTSQTG